jgi:cation diffusion facilitator family transporter
MGSCCEDKSCEVTALRERHAKVLWIVLALNAAMFVVEGVSGWLAHSTSLLADSLDMLGDALVYGFSLFVLRRPPRWQARAAAVKGGFMLVFGAAVLAEAVHKMLVPTLPDAAPMGMVGALALAANLWCFMLLYRHRADGINMRSTWLCSRNDLVANVGVLAAAGATYALASRWPDIVVGCVIAALFLRSALGVLRDVARELETTRPLQA